MTTPTPRPWKPHRLAGYLVTCPECGHKGWARTFEPSLEDECECPECGAFFELAMDDDDS